VAEEEAKRNKHPLDRSDVISALAAEMRFPKRTDIFLTKFHGLFYVAPAQNSFMCRLRIPGGILSAHQLRGNAAIAEDLGGGYADITTRANLQIREISAAHPPEILMHLAELGLTSRGAGADSVRNITGSPTAGIDPQELIDTRPQVRALHHYILHHRELHGLPRKFNIAFDGGGLVPVLEETNDIALSAVSVPDDFAVPPGIYYRLGLGGITGHRDLARRTGVIVAPDDTTALCNSVLRVFIAHGDRTDRTKARLKYLLDRWGMEKFLSAVEKEYGRPLTYIGTDALPSLPLQNRTDNIGIHPQRQPGLHYIGVLCPLGRLSAAQLRGLADITGRCGSGTLSLTVWQNVLISDIATDTLPAAQLAIAALGLGWQASALRSGLVACTGSAGCRFSAGDTKPHAAEIADWPDARISVDQPINIHLTGCHHSCAQHFVADIGLLATRIEQGDDTIEGYDLHVGGGIGANARIGRLIRRSIPLADLKPALLSLLSAWMERRAKSETFQSWTASLSDDALAELSAREMVCS
jgi:ferredoxin-nitrite reductase